MLPPGSRPPQLKLGHLGPGARGSSFFSPQNRLELSCEDESNTLCYHLSSRIASCFEVTEVDTKGNESRRLWHLCLPGPTCKGQALLSTQEAASPNTSAWETTYPLLSLFLLCSHRALPPWAGEVPEERRTGWGREAGVLSLAWYYPATHKKASLGSFLTWSTNETPWDPKIARLTAARHPFIALALCSRGPLLRGHCWGQDRGHQAQCHLRRETLIKDLLWSCHCFSGLASTLRDLKAPHLFWPGAEPPRVQQ